MVRPVVIALVLTGCARGDARELLERLREDDYRSFERAPGWEAARAPSGAPHGSFVDIYVNDVLQEALDDGQPLTRWPEGSIIVKDGWSAPDGGSLVHIAAMEKQDGEWFFAEYDGDGDVQYAGVEDRTCVGCHGSANDRVLAFDLPQ